MAGTMNNNDDDEPACEVIDFAEQRRKRMGIAPSPASSTSARDPGKDKIIELTNRILGTIDDEADQHPIKSLAALQLAMTTVLQCYYHKYGEDTAARISAAARRLSRKYKAVLTSEENDERPDS